MINIALKFSKMAFKVLILINKSEKEENMSNLLIIKKDAPSVNCEGHTVSQSSHTLYLKNVINLCSIAEYF